MGDTRMNKIEKLDRNKKGQFVKGHASSVTEEGIEKMKANSPRYWLGKKRPNIAKMMRDRVVSDETRKKMSMSSKGLSRSPKTMFKKENIPWNKGKKGLQVAWNKGISNGLGGDKHPNWKGGITPIIMRLRGSLEYKEWRKRVFERDGYKCVLCGDDKGGNLEADHNPIPFSFLVDQFRDNLDDCDLLWSVGNGRTLCRDCHSKCIISRGTRTKDCVLILSEYGTYLYNKKNKRTVLVGGPSLRVAK